MRIEIAGAQITDAVVDILDDLQNMTDYTKMYLATLDELTRDIILQKNIFGLLTRSLKHRFSPHPKMMMKRMTPGLFHVSAPFR